MSWDIVLSHKFCIWWAGADSIVGCEYSYPTLAKEFGDQRKHSTSYWFLLKEKGYPVWRMKEGFLLISCLCSRRASFLGFIDLTGVCWVSSLPVAYLPLMGLLFYLLRDKSVGFFVFVFCFSCGGRDGREAWGRTVYLFHGAHLVLRSLGALSEKAGVSFKRNFQK